MKKNIKFTEDQTAMVVNKMAAFKNDIFENVNVELTQTGGTKVFSKAFAQAGWDRSNR